MESFNRPLSVLSDFFRVSEDLIPLFCLLRFTALAHLFHGFV